MMTMTEKKIGILGGMGPEATIDLFQKITMATPAKKDQDHIRIIIDSNPKIPSRQKAILENGPSPLPLLTETARNLEKAGADVIVVACYLSHYFIDDIKRSVRVPVLDLIEEAGRHLGKEYPSAKRVGILASVGAVKTGLFGRKLRKLGYSAIVPDDLVQQRLGEAMNEIKSGTKGPETLSKVLGAIENLKSKGAQVVMIGCTEFPLVLENASTPFPILDPARIAAQRLSRIGRGEEVI
jgi:aspartate racemase